MVAKLEALGASAAGITPKHCLIDRQIRFLGTSGRGRLQAIGIAFAVAAALMSTPAAAAPIYFECQLGQDGQPTPATAPYTWEISLDEARGAVAWILPQSSGSAEATFSAREVRWRRTMGGVPNIFAINRSTLTFTRTATVGERTFIASGRCRIVRAPQRAF